MNGRQLIRLEHTGSQFESRADERCLLYESRDCELPDIQPLWWHCRATY